MSEPIRTPGVTAIGVDRVQTPVTRPDDELDVSLRPRRLDEFVGQEALKSQLEVAIRAAGNRGEALDHVLLAAVAAGDTARLQAVQGVGKRTAERIVVELREKVGAAPADDPIVIARGDDPRLLARDGLVGLGFSVHEADELLDGAPGQTPEDLIAHALREARR